MKWYDKAAFYHIYPLGFCGCPKENDFSGEPVSRILKVIDIIPHLKECGFNAVYFGPVFESSRHGYDTADYLVPDRRLGTEEDFKRVFDAFHENGIKVVLDGVFKEISGRSRTFASTVSEAAIRTGSTFATAEVLTESRFSMRVGKVTTNWLSLICTTAK